MTYQFRPAADFTDRHGCFVALVGGPSAGKTFSSLRLARGIAGPKGRIAVCDTEAGRTLHLKKQFDFDVLMMDPPHRPGHYAEMAKAAEEAGYDALVIDSFSAEWAGVGGVLAWRDEEALRMAGGDEAKMERVKGAAWIKPKMAHKHMVSSFLGRRIPIIFSIRGEESFKPPNEKFFKAICNQAFMFEVTVSFRLASDRKGIIDLSDPKSYKMEGDHAEIFRDGEQLSEAHGEALAKWAKGGPAPERKFDAKKIAREIYAAVRDAKTLTDAASIILARDVELQKIKEADPSIFAKIMELRPTIAALIPEQEADSTATAVSDGAPSPAVVVTAPTVALPEHLEARAQVIRNAVTAARTVKDLDRIMIAQRGTLDDISGASAEAAESLMQAMRDRVAAVGAA